MNASTKTRSALRAALKQEDAALVERLAAGPAGDGGSSSGDALTPASPALKARTRRAGATAIKAGTAVQSVKVRKTTKASREEAGVSEDGSPSAVIRPPAVAVAANGPAKRKRASSSRSEGEASDAKTRDQPAATEADDAKKQKREKVVRDSFSMPASEHRRIKALREQLGKAGRLTSKSEVLRAGLKLLAEREAADLVTLLDALPSVIKGKRSKKH